MTKKVPSYCKHKTKGLAYVKIHGQLKYLGKYGSEESIKRYEKVIAEYLADLPRDDAATVVELCAAYLDWAVEYYRKNGEPTNEYHNCRVVVRKVNKLYGDLDVDDYRPKCLHALMAAWQAEGLARVTVNRYMRTVRRMFKWGVSREMVLTETWQALTSVDGLKKGRCEAPESKPVKPIDTDSVLLTLSHIKPLVGDMIRLQLLAGCRPGELCGLNPKDIDRTDDVWSYVVGGHKMDHHGHQRTVYFGPQAQQILQKYLFSENPFPYTTHSYRRAIHRACDRAGIPRWSPNRLRHTRATEIRKTHGIEAASIILGHQGLEVTQVYAEKNEAVARQIIAQSG